MSRMIRAFIDGQEVGEFQSCNIRRTLEPVITMGTPIPWTPPRRRNAVTLENGFARIPLQQMNGPMDMTITYPGKDGETITRTYTDIHFWEAEQAYVSDETVMTREITFFARQLSEKEPDPNNNEEALRMLKKIEEWGR